MDGLNDRQRQIVELIRQSGQQSINALSEAFGVATQTIRRDINDLCEQGLARRVHGGVAPPSNPLNLNFRARRILNEGPKRAIARAAADLIPDGSCVLLGIGTSVQYVAEALMDRPDMSFVTNNIEVATLLCSAPSAEVHIVGGTLRPEDRDIVGAGALRGFSRFVADVAVIGAGALDAEFGILDFKPFDAEVGQTLLAQCRTSMLVADHSKWSRTARHRVAGFDMVDLFVTDALPPDQAGSWGHIAPKTRLEQAG
ncbi:MAG: DeoR family transcriptional regulator [Rhodobacteraceae bacterium]|nr:DeoR family transcriptional regulator [Paracoccaceae bacterium]